MAHAQGLAVVEDGLSLETIACVAVEDQLASLACEEVEVAVVVPVGDFKAVMVGDWGSQVLPAGVL